MSAGEPILQLKVSLVGASQPPVWRRLVVPATMRLDRLHDVIQAAMGWEDYHLHAFSAGGVDYGPPDPELGHIDERKTRIRDVIGQPKDRMRYIYDFGDHWQHDALGERTAPRRPCNRIAFRPRTLSQNPTNRLALSRSTRRPCGRAKRSIGLRTGPAPGP